MILLVFFAFYYMFCSMYNQFGLKETVSCHSCVHLLNRIQFLPLNKLDGIADEEGQEAGQKIYMSSDIQPESIFSCIFQMQFRFLKYVFVLIVVFWVLTSSSFVDRCWCFRGTPPYSVCKFLNRLGCVGKLQGGCQCGSRMVK